MNSNSNSYPSQSQSPYPQHQQQSSNSISPALLAAYQNGGGQAGNKFSYGGGGGGGGVNPAQLMNDMGMMGNGIGGSTNTQMSPAQLLQQQQGLGGGSGMGMMAGGGMGMGGMGGIDPAMLTQQSHNMSNSHSNNFRMGMGNGIDINAMNMGGMGSMNMAGMNMGGMGNASSSMGLTSPSSMGPNVGQNNFAMNAVMNAMGLSKEQLQQMTPPERQMAGEKVYLAMQQHKNQQQQQQQQMSMDGHGAVQGGNFHANPQQDMLQGLLARNPGGSGGTSGFYERPSSSASSHHHSHSNNSNSNNANPGSNPNHMQQQMMPPPPPRPTTAMAHSSSISRPGTSQSHHSPSSSSNSGIGQRPPSRAGEYSHGHHGHQQQQHFNGIPNGYSTGKSQGQQMHQSTYPSTPQIQNQNPYPQSQQGQGQSQGHGQQHQSPLPPGSPYRGAKRKVGDGNGVVDSPRVTSGMGLPSGGMMGPPVLPRQLSGSGEHFMQHSSQSQSQSQAQHMSMGGNHNPQAQMNGYPSVPQRHTTHSPVNMRPPSSNGLPSHMHAPTAPLPNHQQVNNAQIGLGMMGDEPSVRINPATAGMNMGNAGMMNGMSMNMSGNGMGMSIDSASRTPQRQMSNPPQASLYPGLGVVPPQPHRQPSIPPVTPMKPVVDLGMNMGVGLGITGGGLKLGAIPPGATPSRIPSVAPNTSATASPAQQQTAAASSAVIPQLPSLPTNVNLNPAVTRVTVVPLVDSLKTIPALSDSEIQAIQGWMKIDKGYEATFRKMKDRMAEEAREVLGPGSLAWWEKGSLDINPNNRRRGREIFDVRYPRTRKDRDGRERRKTGRREGLKLPRKLNPEDTDRPEQLVPIRLEFDVEHHKMRDTFVWNLNDPVVTPENFAQSVVDDYSLPTSYHAVITKSIQEQLSDFKAHSSLYDGEGGDLIFTEDTLKKGVLDEAEGVWWESWRKRLHSELESSKTSGKGRKRRKIVKEEVLTTSGLVNEDTDMDRSMTVDEFKIDHQSMHDDMRILIKLDIIVGSIKLEDQFEWDIDNVTVSPEEFAETYARELGLVGEFRTAIAHSIREQVQTYQKSLFLVGHTSDGSLVPDDDLRMSFLPSLSSGARPMDQVQSFTPLLNYLSDGEIEKNEKDRDKDINKRRKRNTRGRRGVALPDREPVRTYRTPAIGFPELDPATLAMAVAATAPMSRRAAAAAASVTIANMVASENGTAFSPQTMPSAPQPTPAASKEKKPKGLFKAPTYPPTVLRPRAHVAAPTPSTAADVTTLPNSVDNGRPNSSTTAPPDSKASKVLSAKRAKELERELKEKEYADGQHPNIINGIWHCSNCGCPESIAIGRRKGPLGDKSQCGICGKFWHRHRRPRPVEYNSDLEFHLGKRKDEELSRQMARRRGGAAALRAQSTTATPAELPSEPQTPNLSRTETELPSRQSPLVVPLLDDDRAISPVSTASSASEPPLAQRKLNGTQHVPSAPPSPAPVTPAFAPENDKPASPPAPPVEPVANGPPKTSWQPPTWLSSAMHAMQTKYPNDKFDVIARKPTPEWRIKCLDCPGKLYTPGPGETLSNYEVHLKNRQHRQRVNQRLNSTS